MLNESLKNVLTKDVTEQIRAAEPARQSRKADDRKADDRKAAGFAEEVKRLVNADERRAAETERPVELQKSSRKDGAPKAAAKKASGAEGRAATDRNQGINNNNNNNETRKHITVSESAANGKSSAINNYAVGKQAGNIPAANDAYAAQELAVGEELAAIPAVPAPLSIEGAALEVRNSQASELISAALAKISSMLNLPSSVSFDEQSLIRFDQESLEQFAEILQALESIGNLLDKVAEGGEDLDADGVNISADEAAMLSADLRVEKFHIQMGLSMIGAREIVSDIMADKYDAPLPASGISQATDPANLGMSTVDTARAFGSLTAEDLAAAIERIKLAKSGQAGNAPAQNTKAELPAADSQEMRETFKNEDNVKTDNVKNEDAGVKIENIGVNKGFSDIPQGFSGIPQGFSGIPQSFSDIPRSFSDIPRSFSDIPQGFSDIPQGFSDIPQSFADIPQDKADIPQDKADVKIDNVKAEDVKIEQVKVENIEDVKIEQVKVENVKVDNVKIDTVKAEDVKLEQVKVENIKVENVKAEDVKLEQVKAENIKAQDVDGVKPENVKAKVDKAENVNPEYVRAWSGKSQNVKNENDKSENVKAKDVKPENVKSENVKSENVKPENVKSETAKIFNSINIPLSVSELANAKTRETKTEPSDVKYAAGFAGVSVANEEAAESAKPDKSAFALNAASQQNVITASEADGAEPQADIVQADIAQAKAQAAVEHVQKATNAFSRVDNEEIIRQITEKMHHAIRSGVQEVRMVLRPEALGEVRMSLRVEGDVVFARIQVENSQVKAIVESQLQNLKDSLEQQNLQAGAFSVDVGADKDRSPREAWQELAEAARRSKFREGGAERIGETEADAVGAATGTDTGRRFGNNSFELFI